MKKMAVASLILLATGALSAQPINVMTFNIRYDTERDSANAWRHRKDKAASQILFHGAEIIGVQEALHNQIMDLQQALPTYNYIGVGRDDGKQRGEYSAIFYDTTRFQVVASETFWLSEQPTVPGSKSWDAAITRIVTWAKFRDRKSRKTFFAFNTHFDHIGKTARRESAKLLLQKLAQIGGKEPIVVTGDFNAQPGDEPILVLMDKTNPMHLTDSKSITQQPHYGPSGTFNGFGPKETSDQPIDYILIRNGFKVIKHATLSQTWEGRFSSDHFPVFAVLSF